MPKKKPKLIEPTADEEAHINLGISQDPDNPEWTDEMWARARPAAEVVPDIVAAYRRMRGKQKAPTKEQISIRLDREIVAHFRKTGVGWHGRINEALRQVVASSEKVSRKPGKGKVVADAKTVGKASRKPARVKNIAKASGSAKSSWKAGKKSAGTVRRSPRASAKRKPAPARKRAS
jgi:uncharacterized protein (DUF4415 family)